MRKSVSAVAQFDTAGVNVNKGGGPGGARPGGDAAAAELSAATRFTMLWEALADVLGTAATATVLRRAARRAAPRCPELAELAIQRANLEYLYTVPSAWKDPAEGTPPALRELVAELRPILIELTGQVVMRHLEQSPELRELLTPQEKER
jgi:hypothetical protein